MDWHPVSAEEVDTTKATDRAIAFAKSPPLFVTLTPVDYLIYETKSNSVSDRRKEDGVRCDPMEKGDPVVLELRHATTYSTFIAARCIQAGMDRKFAAGTRRWKLAEIVLWRVPYRWRPAVARLEGQEFDSREALEEAMRKHEHG